MRRAVVKCADFRTVRCPHDAAVVFADAPYNLGKRYDGKRETVPFERWVKELVSWSRAPWTIILGPWPTMRKWLPIVPEPTRLLVWHRTFVPPRRSESRWTHSLTPILIYEDDGAPWYGPSRNDRDWHDCIDAHSSMGDIQRWKGLGIVDDVPNHPGATGTHLPARVLRGVLTEGDLLVDPMCGLGGVLVAGQRQGARVVGYEIVDKYARFARKWLRAEKTKAKTKASRR